MPTPRPTDPEARKLYDELGRRMWRGTLLRLLIGVAAATFALGVAEAVAAPLSPATQFAFNVAEREVGGTGSCSNVDAQIVPAFDSPSIVAEYSSTGCYVYLSRELAGSQTFIKACKVLVNIFRSFDGRPLEQRLPRTCFMHGLFLLNHPHYLERRFRADG